MGGQWPPDRHGPAVLCNDSHRALDTPNVYWQFISLPGVRRRRATFAGCPRLSHLGHNHAVAWGITHVRGGHPGSVHRGLRPGRGAAAMPLRRDGRRRSADETIAVKAALRRYGGLDHSSWTVVHGDPLRGGGAGVRTPRRPALPGSKWGLLRCLAASSWRRCSIAKPPGWTGQQLRRSRPVGQHRLPRAVNCGASSERFRGLRSRLGRRCEWRGRVPLQRHAA